MLLLRTAPLVGAAVLAGLGAAGPARADATTATGSGGQTLTVSATTGLKSAGQKLTVVGKGFDTGKGIYVAFCKDNGPGKAPTPCGGGADTSGASGGSQWISSNPPSYGDGLAIPFGPGGTFNVEIAVSARISDTVDCRKTVCAVVARADHTRSADRSDDVRVPVTFNAGGTGFPVAAVAAGAVVVILGAGTGALYLRRRRGAAA